MTMQSLLFNIKGIKRQFKYHI